MTDTFSTPDDLGEIRQSELQSSLGERLGAQALDAIDPKNSLSGMYIARRLREGIAGGFAPHDFDGVGTPEQQMQLQDIQERARAAIPETSIEDAKARVKQEGLEGHLNLPVQPAIKSPVLDLMISEAHERRDRETAIARGPQGFIPGALGLVTSLGAGMIDPVNMAAFSIPVLGEARWGKLLASAGDSLAGRAGIRALQGGAQGAVGTAVLQPADWWLHTLDGQDYTMADALKSVAMGAGMGAAFHAGIGGFGDIRARMGGTPLPGSPEDLVARRLMAGRHVPGAALTEEGLTADELAASFGQAQPIAAHPAEALADLPPAAREDVLRSAIADMTQDRPVRAAEMLQIAADHDPRIAESFDAFHGSPHEIDRFSAEHIGTGEGAQAYGHGLYFAENEKVAQQYQRSTTGRDFIRKAQELYDEFDRPDDAHAAIADFTPGQKRLLLALEKDDWLGFDYPHQAVSAALSDPHGKNWEMSPETLDAIKHVGHLYQVRIKANPEHFLDWDKPLSEQSEHVRSKLRAAGFGEAQTGKEVYQSLVKYRPDQGGGLTSAGMKISDLDATPEAASGRLRATGIHGIKYLDQGSRGGATPEFRPYQEGESFYVAGRKPREAGPFKSLDEANAWISEHATRNFVVFDDKHIEITHKNGEPVALPERRETSITINGRTHQVEYPSHGDRAAAAAEDPRWRELSDVRPAHDEPQAIAESRAADDIPEPTSLVPESAMTAAEKAAADAEEVWRKLEPTLTEKERTDFNETLAQMKTDKEARARMITDGAACLAAAIAA